MRITPELITMLEENNCLLADIGETQLGLAASEKSRQLIERRRDVRGDMGYVACVAEGCFSGCVIAVREGSITIGSADTFRLLETCKEMKLIDQTLEITPRE